MINSESYKKIKDYLSVLRTERNVLQSTIFQINEDLNIKIFLESIIYKVENYENLKHMEKYYFKNDAKTFYDLLNSLFHTFLKSSTLKNKSSSDISKGCIVFSDSYGEIAIRYFSYLPILKVFIEKIDYLEIIENMDSYKRNDEESDMDLRTIQKEVLFGNSFLAGRSPKDKDFIDYDLKYNYSLKMKKEYEDKKDYFDETIKLLTEQFKHYENKSEVELTLGKCYYDNARDSLEKESQEFANIFKTMISNINKTKKQENL